MAGGKKRIFIAAAVFFVCLAIFGSFLFIFCGADHECDHGDDCEICRVIDICVHTIRFAAVIFAAIITVVCVTVAVRTVFTRCPWLPTATLISLKTELRN